MKNKIYVLLLLFFTLLGGTSLLASTSSENIEELSGYFEIRDTIQMMNDEMKRGLNSKNDVSLFDEEDIEFKLESFIGFMKNRINMYAKSDSKMKLHYVKKLNSLLEETAELYASARPIINSKREYKITSSQDNILPPVSYSTIEHPYFNPIDFRTLASREPLDVDFTNIRPLPTEKDKSIEKSIEIAKSKYFNEEKYMSDKEKEQFEKLKARIETIDNSKQKENKPTEKTIPINSENIVNASETNQPSNEKSDNSKKDSSLPPSNAFFIINQPLNNNQLSNIAGVSSITTNVDSGNNSVVDTGKDDYMRPMAVMVENHNQARPQSGLYNADVVYEIPVEGGITRFMALFTKMPGLIGPIRSCREYFVDRALEVDALYVHCGGSPMGYAYISKSKIRSVDEIKNSPPFFRDKLRKAPHNLYGKGEAIYNYMAKRVDMRVKDKPEPLNYGIRDELGSEPGVYLKINYHGNYTLVIKEENSVYHRYMNNILHLDRETKKPLEANAVVLQVAAMKVVDAVGRQDISFIGSGSAYIFENGKRTAVTWNKPSPRSKTTYIDEKGKEYLFNDKGQVWVLVVSPNHKVFFEPVSEEAKDTNKAKTKANKKG